MKISGIRSSIVALPADEPLADAAENPDGTRPIVTLQVETDQGVVGLGVTYFGGALTGASRRSRQSCAPPRARPGPAASSTSPTRRSTWRCGTFAAC